MILDHEVTGPEEAPVLLLGGSPMPPYEIEVIADTVVDARLETLSPAAHVAAVEQADATNRLIGEHLR